MSECAVIFRQRQCRWAGCGAIFHICRCCDRGHQYCSGECREKSRQRQHREANRTVAQRTKEIGIRISLGAQSTRAMGMMMREAAMVMLCGIAIAIPAYIALSG